MKILFVCSRNRLRSPTAETIFSEYPGIEALSAGTSPDADNPVSAELIEWADRIVAMEDVHKRRLNEIFGQLLRGKRIVVLGILDNFEFMQPELIRALKEKAYRFLPKSV